MTTLSSSFVQPRKWLESPEGVEGHSRVGASEGLNPALDRSAETLLPLVYRELKALAAAQLSREPAGGRSHTLQPTALVHEAFLKMSGEEKGYAGRDHFMAVAAVAMRHILVDHARRKKAEKRGGDAAQVDVSVELLGGEEPGQETRDARVLWLHDLLNELAQLRERTARVAEMRLFGGMDFEQIARVLDVTRMTVHRDWTVARAWLAAKMQDASHD